MIPELELTTKRLIMGRKDGARSLLPKRTITGFATSRLGLILLSDITRLLRTVRGLKGPVYVVGGVVTEGRTLRDLDIVFKYSVDIPIIKRALGKYAQRAHFIQQKREPPAPLFLKITGREPGSPDLTKGKKRIPKYEYAI